MRISWKRLAAVSIWLILLLLSIFRFDLIEGPLNAAFGARQVMRLRAPLYDYAWQHVQLVLVSTGLSLLIGLTLSLAVSLPLLSEFRRPLLSSVTFMQTVPSTAVLALSVPLMGYGQLPVVMALVFYGLLPIVRNTIEGLDAVAPDVLLTAAGMGMTPAQRLTRVAWPLALPAVLAGIRTSVIINISAATIGAAVGAGGLGVLIVNGIRSMDVTMILKGALPVSLLALLTGSLFSLLEPAWRRRMAGA